MTLQGISYPFRKEDGQFPKIDVDQEAVRSNILALFGIPLGARVMRPTIGTAMDLMVFESQGPLLNSRIQREVRATIARGEPRATVKNVAIATSGTLVIVDILYEVSGLEDTVQITMNTQ